MSIKLCVVHTHDQLSSYRVFLFRCWRSILLIGLETDNPRRRATSAEQRPSHLLVVLKHEMIVIRRASNRTIVLREENLFLSTDALPVDRLCNIQVVASADDRKRHLNPRSAKNL